MNAERDLVILGRQLAVAADPAERGAIEAKMAKKTQVKHEVASPYFARVSFFWCHTPRLTLFRPH